MRRSRSAIHPKLRLAAAALALLTAGGQCLRLAGGEAFASAGLLGLGFLTAPQATGKALYSWLTPAAQQVQTQPQTPEQSPQPQLPSQPAQSLPVLPEVTLPETFAPQDTTGWLPVKQVQYPASGAGERYISLAAGSIRNLTSYPAAELRQLTADGGLPFAVELNSDQPQVLIMHTHATECYAEADGLVDPANNGRTTDVASNMVAVGAMLAGTLNAAGIHTVQDGTLHDYPSYNGSYGRSRATVEKWLAEYPSIKIVLDVHRDAIESDGVRIKPTAEINGVKAAQLMIISGADDGTMGMPNFRQNLQFAAALQTAVEGWYPGLTRPVLFDYRNYNQQLTTGSLLLEIGGHGNTLQEALYTVQLVGTALAELLTQHAAG